MLQATKPQSRRARRLLEKRAPKIDENVKKMLLLQGSACSNVLKGVIADFHQLKKPGQHARKFTRRNDNIHLFEGLGETSLEYWCRQNDCSLFMVGSHTKKRPHNLTLGRMYDFHIYDLLEVGVEQYKSIASLGGGHQFAPQEGSKPCFAFIGQAFDSDGRFQHFKEYILDAFRGEVVEAINLAGLDHVYLCVAAGDKVLFRHCAIRLMKSGTKVPRVELIEVGPSLDLVLRRQRLPNQDMMKAAMKSTRTLSTKKVKNVSGDLIAGKVGRIYIPKQEVGEMALSKMKGLKRERREAAASHNHSQSASVPENELKNKKQRFEDNSDAEDPGREC